MAEIKCSEIKSLSHWRDSIRSRHDIMFDEVKFVRGYVCGAHGRIIYRNKAYKVVWVYDGKCFYKGRRLPKYDLTI